VLIFNPAMSSATIQSQLNAVYAQQQTNQFGTNRYALLFEPGTYNVNVNVGFYMQVLGLGLLPDSTTINGSVQADAAWNDGNATENFWREAENLAVVPAVEPAQWAVSQASPLRRMHIKGNLWLFDVVNGAGGWASGGFMADTAVDDTLTPGSQQQWFSRNSSWATWTNAVWNMVFLGDVNAPAQNFPPSAANGNPYTTLPQTPEVSEKPFLTIDSAGAYSVFVPAMRTNSAGTTWSGGAPAGTSIPIGQFYIAHATSDTAATINAALSQGTDLILTPGVYQLSAPIQISNPDTVVLGLGVATLQPTNGTAAMTVADVNGVKIGGILFDAGATNSPVLFQVGPPGSSANHAFDPIELYDIYTRIGGATVGNATVSLQINSSNVIGDNFWLWRADHGNPGTVGWTTNTSANGLVVNGNNVTIYGLAVEHFQQYQTLWNGNGGQVYFYQSEAPYDPPNQAAWMDDSTVPPTDGYASYKVANTVTTHTAYGVGIYCNFEVNNQPTGVQLQNAIEVPSSSLNGAMFHDMVTVSLGGVGTIDSIIDGYGGTANATNEVQYLGQ